MFISIEEAIKIVMILASENILEEKDTLEDPEVLVPMRDRQLAALDTVHDFFVNNVFD